MFRFAFMVVGGLALAEADRYFLRGGSGRWDSRYLGITITGAVVTSMLARRPGPVQKAANLATPG